MNTPGQLSSPSYSTIRTAGFAHYNVAWSPFHTNQLALASSANYGLVGNGRLHVVSLSSSPAFGHPPIQLSIQKWYATQDGLYDLAWSEIHENQIVTASGDGALRLWDITLNDLPIKIWKEHSREVYSVDWSNVQKDRFASASWEGKIKIWSPEHAHSLTTLNAATTNTCVYQAVFSPFHPSLIASCSADGTTKIFDLRSPALLTSATSFTQPLSTPVMTIPPAFSSGSGSGSNGGSDVLSIDWNKYRNMVLASAGADRKIRVWDCRMLNPNYDTSLAIPDQGPLIGGNCEADIPGHEYAVRKVQWCPHRHDVLASASYDMSCRIWHTNSTPAAPNSLIYIHDAHTEFVVGCAWSLYDEGVLASCAWDCRLDIFRVPLK